jgi:hypothetical protein
VSTNLSETLQYQYHEKQIGLSTLIDEFFITFAANLLKNVILQMLHETLTMCCSRVQPFDNPNHGIWKGELEKLE